MADREDQSLIARIDGQVGWLIFDNPARHNALTDAMCTAMVAALERFEADPAVRVCVMCGAGEKAFISGADIGAAPIDEPSRREKPPVLLAFDALRAFGKPLVAMIRGWCLGGGLAVALMADFRIADESAKFGVPAARLGVGYPLDAVADLVSVVGPAKAKIILFTAARMSAGEAMAAGLVDEVLSPAELAGRITEVTGSIVDNAPLSIRAAKAAVDHVVRGTSSAAGVEALIDACLSSDDFREGRAAFLEKRPPAFKGV